MIRTAAAKDAAALAALAAATFPLACPPDALPASIQAFIDAHLTEGSFEAYLADPARVLLIAEQDGTPSGYTMLVWGEPTDPDVVAALTHRPTVELSKCYVLAQAHGSGLAGELITASIAAARERGAAGIWLGVNNENVKANRFYEKHGFVRVGTKKFLVGERWEDDFVRERRL
jgi:ribosomal protein S18 acetylase RimI-like enzyme